MCYFPSTSDEDLDQFYILPGSLFFRIFRSIFIVLGTLIYFLILGASEITANLYCNCVYLYLGRQSDLQYIFAVINGTLSIKHQILSGLKSGSIQRFPFLPEKKCLPIFREVRLIFIKMTNRCPLVDQHLEGRYYIFTLTKGKAPEDKKFFCSECDKSFSNLNNMQVPYVPG